MAAIPENSTFSNATEVYGPGDFFVSAIDAGKYFLMAGPFEDHAEAGAAVEEAKKLACDHDPRAIFMAWGTCRLGCLSGKVGALNKAGLWKEGSEALVT